MTLKALNQYGKGFQLKVLGSLLTDKKFVLNVRDVLKEEYFDADSHKWIINEIINYFDKYHTTITMDVLKVELQKLDNEILVVALKEELRNSYAASQDDLAYVQEEFLGFCKNQEMKHAILSSADLLKDGDFDGIRNMVEKAMRAGMDKNMGHEYNKDCPISPLPILTPLPLTLDKPIPTPPPKEVSLINSAFVSPIPLIESGVSIPKHEIGNPLSVPVFDSTGDAKFNHPFHI